MSQDVAIILLDDDADEHFLFETDLEDAGFQLNFKGFTRSDDALEFLSQGEAGPVLALTDLGLGSDDAVAFIRQASSLLGGGAIGVYSGARNPDTERVCREAGASFYALKPITPAALEAAIADIDSIVIETTPEGRFRLIPA